MSILSINKLVDKKTKSKKQLKYYFIFKLNYLVSVIFVINDEHRK